MLCTELLDRLINIYTATKITPEKGVALLQDAITHIHNLFPIHREQALILVSGERKVFRLNGNVDPNVAMAVAAKTGRTQTTTIQKYSLEQFNDLKKTYNDTIKPRFFADTLYPYLLNSMTNSDSNVISPKYAVFQDIFPPRSSDEIKQDGRDFNIFPHRMEVLKILDVYKNCDCRLGINSKYAFSLSQDLINLPYAKDGELYMVEYQPKPLKFELIEEKDWLIEHYDEENDTTEWEVIYDKWWRKDVDLPDQLIDLAIAYCMNKLVLSINGTNQYHYQNANANYINELQKAQASGAVTSLEMIDFEDGVSSSSYGKGFW